MQRSIAQRDSNANTIAATMDERLAAGVQWCVFVI
jgi:hypothetical protein